MTEGCTVSSSSEPVYTDAKGKSVSKKYVWFIFLLVALLTLIDSLDSTIVNISIQPISRELGCDQSAASLILIAYTTPMVGLIILFGKLFQTRRLKNILIGSLIVFAMSSFGCGCSRHIEVMIFWRFIQGISAAALASATPVLIVRELPETETSMGLAIMAVMTGTATTLGPILGNIITDVFNWNWIFYINIPICIALVVLVFFFYRESNISLNAHMPDLSVCICYALATMAFVYAITDLENQFFVPCILLVVAVITGLYVYRHTMDDIHENKMFHKTLLRNRNVILATLSFICTTITSSLISYLLPFYFRTCLGINEIGIYFGASALITIICSVIAGKWCQRHHTRNIIIISILCRIAFALIFTLVTPDMGLAPIFVGLAFMGVSFGFSGTAQPTRIIHHAEEQDKEDASNVMISANYIGASLGVAMCVIVMFIAVPGSYGVPIANLSSGMIVDSLHACSIFSIVVNLIALTCTLLVKETAPECGNESAKDASHD